MSSRSILVAADGWLPSFLAENMYIYVYAAARSLQSCPTLCDPIDGSPPGSPVPGSLQARTLEWVAISFSNAGKWKVKGKSPSWVRLLATPWTAAHQASPSMGYSRQKYWSGVPLPSLSLSLSIYIYIYICIYLHTPGFAWWLTDTSDFLFISILILNTFLLHSCHNTR